MTLSKSALILKLKKIEVFNDDTFIEDCCITEVTSKLKIRRNNGFTNNKDRMQDFILMF